MGEFARFKKGHNNRGENLVYGSLHPSWKGGKSDHGGYTIIKKPYYKYAYDNGYVLEHRYIMYIYLSILNGKPTYIEGFDVHHKNEDTKDNRISNLQLILRSDHVIHHNKGNKYSLKDKSDRVCNLCKSNKTAQWYNDIIGFLCANCYKNIRYYIKKD